jgi:hypothetical protein
MAAPTVTAQAAASIDYQSQTLNGTMVTKSVTVTSYGFHLGPDTSYGTTITVASADIANGTPFTAPATGLVENTVYHFRSFAVNADGTGVSADRTFTTARAPAAYVIGGGTDWYVVDNSGTQGPKVMSRHSSQREAERSLLGTADAQLYDQGTPFSSLGLEGTQPAP